MIINDEPWDWSEAKELEVWVDACKDEIFSIEKNNTWELVDLPVGIKPIDLKWVFKIKRNADGSISKYKARLVAKGYVQRHGVDYDEVFAPIACIETICLVIAIAASQKWEIHISTRRAERRSVRHTIRRVPSRMQRKKGLQAKEGSLWLKTNT